MARSLLVLTLVGLSLTWAYPSAHASAQSAISAASAHDELARLHRSSEEVESGLADVRRRLALMGVRGMDGLGGAARLVLTFEDHFAGLTPISAAFALDGQRLYTSADAAQIERGAIFTGAIPSGPHVLTLELRYRGDILYTTGYQATITSSYTFQTSLGQTTRLRVIGHDTGPLAPFEERWTIGFETETEATDE